MSHPVHRFHDWFAEAESSEPTLHTAVALATADQHGVPSVRMVLCKTATEEGFFFYTNLGSPKARELAENPNAALCFHWKSVSRQVRVSGPVEPVSAETADAYFATRARLSQIGAWASKQSTELPDRLALEKRVAKYTAKFGVGKVPRPAFWSGFCLKPVRVEFWEELPFRLHRREEWTLADGGWESRLLFP